MTVALREAHLQSDRDELITFLYDNLTERSNGSRFNWLYLENPAGRARAWMASNHATGETVGLGAAFPRWVWVDQTPRLGWVLGDLCIAPGSRSLGPALLLQRGCLQSLALDGNPIWFDFPSRSMMAIYRRLGVPIAGSHVRYVKLYKIDKKVERYIPGRLLARRISRIGNLALKFQRATYHIPGDIETSLHEGLFREEFTAMDASTTNLHTIRGLRTAEYLNWRYMHNPINRHQVVVARRGGRLLGYAVLEISGPNWILTDLHVVEEANTIPCILAYVDHLAEISNVDSISAPVMEGATLVRYLRNAGFYPREATPVVAQIGHLQVSPPLKNAQNWFLMHGDRES